MCSLTPSVTLYGTTQVPTVRTITHSSLATVLGEPVISLLTIQITECDFFGRDCGPQFKTSLVTVTPSVTTTVLSVETKTTIATNVIPQQTLYYPCTFALTSETRKQAGGQVTKEANGNMDGASTFDGVVSQTPTPTSSMMRTTSISAAMASSSLAATLSSISSDVNGSISGSTVQRQTLNVPSSAVNSDGSASSGPAQTGIVDSSHNSMSKSSHGPAIAGGIAGGVIALLLLCIIATYSRRCRSERQDHRSVSTDNYWERRFRALEAEANGTIVGTKEAGSPDSEIPPDHPVGGFGKKLRLTLDLKSKGMSNRPASRLSMISAFFARPQPAPFQAASSREPLNFSRPGFGHKRRTSKVSGVSGGRSVNGERGSRVPSVNSVAAWLNFGGSQRGSPEVRTRIFRADEEEEQDGNKKAMEWIRPGDEMPGDPQKRGDRLERMGSATENGGCPSPIALRRCSSHETTTKSPLSAPTLFVEALGDSPSTPSLLPTHNPLGGPSAIGRRLTPPKPVQGASVQSKTSQSSLAPSTNSLYSNDSSEPSFSASRPATRQLIVPPATTTNIDDFPPSSWANTKPASRSYSTTRETKGKIIPSLHLSREAITPSLWIDEDLYDQFQRGEGNKAYRQPSEHLQRSHFSPDSSIPTESHLMSIAEDPYGGIASTEADDTRTTSGLNSASTFTTAGGSVDEAPTAWISRAERGERSAVTPQLPIMTLRDDSSLGIDWSGEGEERMVSLYHSERY